LAPPSSPMLRASQCWVPRQVAKVIVSAPDQKWAADTSYIWTAEGWLYLAIVLDLFSRRIVGWAVSDRLKKDLALSALQRALVLRQPKAGILHHSDRGSQYCSYTT
jgi:putative transposase